MGRKSPYPEEFRGRPRSRPGCGRRTTGCSRPSRNGKWAGKIGTSAPPLPSQATLRSASAATSVKYARNNGSSPGGTLNAGEVLYQKAAWSVP
ncbi:hypothetical protein EES42_31545 [Streptomyces sp. ADI95-17]|nr:hypothetical protein EES42_31545 [Streptomyces sp. ADI95-17]